MQKKVDIRKGKTKQNKRKENKRKEVKRKGEKKTESEIRISAKRIQNHLPNNAHFCCRLPTT